MNLLSMFAQGILLKQFFNVVLITLLILPRCPALVPGTQFFTEFQVSAPDTSSLVQELYQFVAELCLAVPGLPCSTGHNITIS